MEKKEKMERRRSSLPLNNLIIDENFDTPTPKEDPEDLQIQKTTEIKKIVLNI